MTNDENEAYYFVHGQEGLLDSMIDPRGQTYEFDYYTDSQACPECVGNLISDEGPDGNLATLTRIEDSDGYEIDFATYLGRTDTYRVEGRQGGNQERIHTRKDGKQTIGRHLSELVELTSANGSKVRQKFGPDPRFGMLAPVTESMTLTFPTTPVTAINVEQERSITLNDSTDPLSMLFLEDTVTPNVALNQSAGGIV